MLICHCSVKGKPSHPHSVSQQAGRTGDIGLGCAEPSLAACGSHPGFSIPRSLPKALQDGGRSLSSSKNSFLWEVWNEASQVCDGHNTLKCWNNYRVRGKWFFSPKDLVFLFFFWFASWCQIFPVQGFHFPQRADSKSSFIQEKMKPSLGILGLMQKHAGVVFGDKRDLGNPGNYFSPFSFPKSKWKATARAEQAECC